MFDEFALTADSLRNVTDDGAVVGYAVDARISYYRGLGLSMVEVALEVDGERIPAHDITFTVHGNSYRSDDMGEVFDDRWGFTESATLTVCRPGGLSRGEHVVQFTESLRVAYAMSPDVTQQTRTMTVV